LFADKKFVLLANHWIMDKKSLRRLFLEKRKSLSKKEVSQKSKIIRQKTLELPQIIPSKCILLYLPINNEVGTFDLIRHLQLVGKIIYLPAYSNENYDICEFVSFDNLKVGPYGILQPINNSTMDTGNIDMAILPGVAFDKSGTRLGYGKGVYDRLLKNSRLVKIGLGYEFQVEDKLPKESHDVVLNVLVTDKKVYQFI